MNDLTCSQLVKIIKGMQEDIKRLSSQTCENCENLYTCKMKKYYNLKYCSEWVRYDKEHDVFNFDYEHRKG